MGMPWLLPKPPKRGQPVDALLEGTEPSIRAERAPNALDHHLQTALSEQPPEDQPNQLPPPIGERSTTVG